MGKKAIIGIVIVIVVGIAGIYLQYAYPQEPLTESGAKDIIKERYPNLGDDDITTSYEENCTVCDELGCRTIEDCWIANFTINQTNHGVVIDGSPGGGGGIVSESESPCTEWWCDAQPCVYTYKEIITNGSKTYYNTGCENPNPVCDQQYERCRECETPSECIRKTITKTGETSYHYDVIDVDAWGSINDTDYSCIIFDEGGLVFHNQTTVEECELIMSVWSRCLGTCDFEPEFGLIPY